MQELITITREQYKAELDAAYAAGRSDERKHLQERGRAIVSAADARHTQMERFLRSKGWQISGNKVNGTEWIDNSNTVRLGVPHQLVSAAWKQFVLTLSAYYRKSPQEIEQEIKSYRRR